MLEGVCKSREIIIMLEVVCDSRKNGCATHYEKTEIL